jgi:hypothetical protein
VLNKPYTIEDLKRTLFSMFSRRDQQWTSDLR